MITSVSNGRGGQVVFEFSNGNEISILWAWGSYSDNHMNISDPNYRERMDAHDWTSKTVEIYARDTDSNFAKYLEREWGSNPAGYVPVQYLPKILKRADRKPYKKKASK